MRNLLEIVHNECSLKGEPVAKDQGGVITLFPEETGDNWCNEKTGLSICKKRDRIQTTCEFCLNLNVINEFGHNT